MVPPLTVASPFTNPVTASEKMKFAVMTAVELMFAGTPVISTVGGLAISQTAVAETADAGPVLRPSVAEFAFTVTVTSD